MRSVDGKLYHKAASSVAPGAAAAPPTPFKAGDVIGVLVELGACAAEMEHEAHSRIANEKVAARGGANAAAALRQSDKAQRVPPAQRSYYERISPPLLPYRVPGKKPADDVAAPRRAASALHFYRNGERLSAQPAFTNLTEGVYYPAVSCYSGAIAIVRNKKISNNKLNYTK